MYIRNARFNGGFYSEFSHRNDLPFTSRKYSTKGSRDLPAMAGNHSHVHGMRRVLRSIRRESSPREDVRELRKRPQIAYF